MTRTRHIRGKWTVRHREPLLSRLHIYLSVSFLLVAIITSCVNMLKIFYTMRISLTF